jgi:hypothetical protein
LPNIKIYVDEALSPDERAGLYACAEPLRTLVCEELHVPTEACQLAFIPFRGLAGQPDVNVEILMLRAASRTQQKLECLAGAIHTLMNGAGARQIAVRCHKVIPEDYVTLKQ